MDSIKSADNAGLRPFNHITLTTGHNYPVPIDQVWPETIEVLTDLVRAGGGPIPNTGGRYKFCITASDIDACCFSIWSGEIPILLCIYHEDSPGARQAWQEFLSEYRRFGVSTTLAMPAAPWLGVVIMPIAEAAGAKDDLCWMAVFEQAVVETWRRLPSSVRGQIRSAEMERICDAQSGSDGLANDRAANGSDIASGKPCRKCAEARASVGGLRNALKQAQERERDFVRKAEELRAEATALGKEKDALLARVDSLSTESLQREVAAIKATIEDRDLRILELEEEAGGREGAIKSLEGRIDDMGRRIRWLEGRLREHAIPVP